MKRIADYRLEELISQGNHGEIYRAPAPPRLNLGAAPLAVKVLSHNGGDEAFRRMANELKLLASVESPHLVQLFDAGQQDGVLFYAMEYSALGTLANPAHPLPLIERLAAVADAARGAHALHEAGVAHRDIKPANVLLSSDGTAKLADLGLAQILSPGQTATGVGPIGSIEYMEPGVIRGERAGRASDVWSLGVTLHWAATGASVYGTIPSRDVVAALRHVLTEGPRMSPDIDPRVGELVTECLHPERSSRPATAERLATRIDEVVREL